MNKENRIIWQKLEELGWCKEPTGIELDFFEDVIKCTKEAINYTLCCESDSEQLVLFADWLQYNGKWDLPKKQTENFLKEQQEQN